jgi:hypothetical protein
LGAWDFWSDKRNAYFDAQVRIDDVTREEVIGEMGRKSAPILLYCSGPKRKLPAPYIVTKTSGKTLEILFGENPRGWIGKTITFYVRKDKRVSKGTGAVLVIRNTRGSQELVEELRARERVDEEEFARAPEDPVPEREPGEEG